MNYGRLAGAAVSAAVVDMIYGFLVYGILLSGQFARYPAIFRPADVQAGYMPVMMGGILIGMFAATWIYSKGYEGGSGAVEGARFGAAVGVFLATYAWITNYAIMNIGRRFLLAMMIAGIVEWIIVGTVIGLVYRTTAPVRRPATV